MTSMIEKTCGCCGNKMTVRLADHNRGWGKFCSKSCKAKKAASKRKRSKYPRHDGMSPMKHKNCQVCGERAVNGVRSPFGEDGGIEWLCQHHMDDTVHPFSEDAFS